MAAAAAALAAAEHQLTRLVCDADSGALDPQSRRGLLEPARQMRSCTRRDQALWDEPKHGWILYMDVVKWCNLDGLELRANEERPPRRDVLAADGTFPRGSSICFAMRLIVSWCNSS